MSIFACEKDMNFGGQGQNGLNVSVHSNSYIEAVAINVIVLAVESLGGNYY